MSAAKGWQKIDKSWPKDWQIVGKKTLAQCRPKVGPMLPNIVKMLAQCRPNIADVGPPDKTMSRRRRSADGGPTLVPMSAQHWPDVRMLSGTT